MSDKILIIGGLGYVGSKLSQYYNYDVQSVDLNLFFTDRNNIANYQCDYSTLNVEYLNKFKTIVLLAGHSSVRMCDLYPASVYNNNVTNFVNLIKKLNADQTLIYASSGSVYGDCKVDQVSETHPLDAPYNMYDLTKQNIDTYCLISKPKCRFFGLRFGTVNGYSPVLRNDVMLNVMTNNAILNKKVLLFNEHTKRSILGTHDLCRAIECIVKTNKSTGGIYNLASFTKTSGEMAKLVAKKTNAILETVVPDEFNKRNLNEKLVSSKYNFSLSCDKFINEFNFKFEETPESIIESLIDNWNDMVMTNRNSSFNYGEI